MGPIFQSQFEVWFMLLFIAVIGYAGFRGCEAGCSYVRDRVDVQWKAVGK